jgi:hypothetical protein
MFRTPTVFILGAGASWHYGYPTGEELVKKVSEKASHVAAFFEHSAKTENLELPQFLIDKAKPGVSLQEQWQAACAECQALKAAFAQLNPLVIDYFLGWNPHLQPIGRLLIAWVILECEEKWSSLRGNINRKDILLHSPLESERHAARGFDVRYFKDDWCRFVIHTLAINCGDSTDLSRNDVRFVTFNYDISLELEIYQGLRHIQLFKPVDVDEFLSSDRVLHIYGKVRDLQSADLLQQLQWDDRARNPTDMSQFALIKYRTEAKAFYDALYTASKGLRVIDPHDKETNKDVIKSAIEAIERAKRVYILGYGFDENNSGRLNLSQHLHYGRNEKSVLFTNFGDINRVNKRVSKVLFGHTGNSFNPPVGRIERLDYEKSVRDVYQALELDFDSLEE